MPFCHSHARFGAVVLSCLLAWLVAGCADSDVGKCFPVEGQVLIDGRPLQGLTGSVVFVADTDKGNTIPHRPAGTINAEGRYKLFTRGKDGAPTGWYKVLVTAVPPGTGDREVTRPVFDSRYTNEALTPLSVEVVPNPAPGKYDLPISRR